MGKPRFGDQLMDKVALVPANKAEIARRMKAAKQQHDSLEKTCVKLAWYKYKVMLLKSDSEAVKVATGVRFRCTSGIPDCIGIIPPTGLFAGFEFKTGHAKLRQNQKLMHREIERHGGKAFTIRSTEQFCAVMEQLLQIENKKFQKQNG